MVRHHGIHGQGHPELIVCGPQETAAADDGRSAKVGFAAVAHDAEEGAGRKWMHIPSSAMPTDVNPLLSQIAEKLYQGGFLSYPRTETDQYDKDCDFMSLIRKQTVDPQWGGFAQG